MTVPRWWTRRSSPQRLDLYIRWSLYITCASLPIAVLPAALMGAMSSPDGNVLGIAGLVLVAAGQTVSCLALLRAGFGTLLGGPSPDRWLVIAAIGLTAAAVAIASWAIPDPAPGDGSLIVLIAPLIGGTLTTAVTPVLSRRALVAGIGLGAAVTIGWHTLAVGDDWPAQLIPGLVYTVAVGLLVLLYRISELMLVLVWEIEASRAAQTGLAVAEERLRFARDFHDVLGRNLTLIAVTSDLAAGLARRGEITAVDKMLEVRGLAHESAREVREMVAGYRSTDLATELAGARSVLRAAGIHARIIGDSSQIPPAAGSAFAWVLREATTNVIRHSHAGTCTIELGPGPRAEPDGPGTAVLRIRNDGSPPRDPFHPPGHGLAGLRERVTSLGGQLIAGPEPGGWFTVEARVPATGGAP